MNVRTWCIFFGRIPQLLNKHVWCVGCGWQFVLIWLWLTVWLQRCYTQHHAKSYNQLKYQCISHLSHQFRLQSPRLVRYLVVANHSKPSNNQMRCPCSMHFSAFDSMTYESIKEHKQRMVASLVVMLFFFHTFWQGINPSQTTLTKRNRDVWVSHSQKSLELFTSFLFFFRLNGGTLKPKIL